MNGEVLEAAKDQSRSRLTRGLLSAFAIVGSLMAVPAVASAAFEPSLCAAAPQGASIPAGFLVDACFDGSTLVMRNDTKLAVDVATRGDIGKPTRSTMNFELPAVAARGVDHSPTLLVPGDTLRFPVGPGGGKLRLTGSRGAGTFELASAFDPFIPTRVAGVARAFVQMMKEVDDDFADYAKCQKSGDGRIHDIRCKAAWIRDVTRTGARFVLHGGLSAAKDSFKKLLGVALSGAEFGQWLDATTGDFKALTRSGTLTIGHVQADAVRASILWSTDADIDLHAFDSSNNHAYFEVQDGIPTGLLSEDIIPGAGESGRFEEHYTDTVGNSPLAFCVNYYNDPSDGTPTPTPVVYTITDPGGATHSGLISLSEIGSYQVIGSSPTGSVASPECASDSSPPDPPVTPPTNPTTWQEQESIHHPVNTFQNYHNASGQGPSIATGQWVTVSCKVLDGTIASVNPDGYWYRIASSPWNNAYYAPANTSMNGDPPNGPYTHNTDFAVRDC